MTATATDQATEDREAADHGHREPSAPAGRRLDVPSVWVTVSLTLLVLAAATGYSGVIEKWAWYPAVAGCVLGAALGIGISRLFRWGQVLAPLAGVLGTILAANLIFFQDTAWLGVIPNGASLDQVWNLIGASRETIANQVAPVTPEAGVVFLVAIAMALILVLMDVLALGMQLPLAAGLGIVVAWVTPAIIKPSSVGMLSFVLTAAAFLIFLAVTHWYLQARAPGSPLSSPRFPVAHITAISAGTLAIAVVLPLVIPGFTQGTFPQGTRVSWGSGNGLNPYVTLGQDLRSPAGRGAFTYESTAEQPPYMRSSVIADFSGQRWGPDTSDTGTLEISGNAQLAGLGSVPNWLGLQQRGIQVQQVRSRVSAGSFTSPWLLAPFQVTSVGSLNGNWRFDSVENTFRGIGANTQNMTYDVNSIIVVPTAEQVNQLNPPLAPGTQFPIPEVYQRIPENVPQVVTDTARQVVDAAGARTPFDQAVAIQRYLRSSEFTYSEQAPVDGGYDGSGLDVIEQFLSAKSGYCVHFAGSMAVMLRTLGIPTRIAVGFTAGTPAGEGEPISDTPTQKFEVESKDAHAWPEVYFNEVGWLPFEPTPSRGVVPEYAQTEGPAPTDVPDDALDPRPSPAAPLPGNEPTPQPTDGSPVSIGTSQGAPVGPILISVGAVLSVVALALLPFWVRTAKRRRRYSLLSDAPGTETASIGAWKELRDTAIDYGHNAPAAMTPREYTAWLGDSLEADEAARTQLSRLSQDFERRNYAPATPAENTESLNDALESTRTTLDAHASWAERLRARFLPRSLWVSRNP